MGVSHSVFLSFKEGADEDAIQEFWDKLDEFPTMKPGLRHWISGKPGTTTPSPATRTTSPSRWRSIRPRR